MKKEQFEWIHSWCDNTDRHDLPRILLIGDSITHGYQSYVRKKLEGICYVDYVSTSYSLDNPFYFQLVSNFVKNSEYDLIHFNHGLHGYHISDKSFERRVRKVIDYVSSKTKAFTIANITCINKPGNKKPHPGWMKRVVSRNAIYELIAKEKGFVIDDLFSFSSSIPVEKRFEDGTHYVPEGYDDFANKVSEFIKANLK